MAMEQELFDKSWDPLDVYDLMWDIKKKNRLLSSSGGYLVNRATTGYRHAYKIRKAEEKRTKKSPLSPKEQQFKDLKEKLGDKKPDPEIGRAHV